METQSIHQGSSTAPGGDSTPLAIDSFHPIFSEFGPHYLIAQRLDGDDVYLLHGEIPPDVVKNVSSYLRGVHEYTFKESNERGPVQNIHPGAYLRLVHLLSQASPGPLFPSLRSLRLHGPASLDHLGLFLTPSLQTLEVVHIPEQDHVIVSNFLETLTEFGNESNLGEVTLGPGTICVDWCRACPKFDKLHTLKIVYESDTALEYNLLTILGDLPLLNSFELDATLAKLYRDRTSIPVNERIIAPLPRRAWRNGVPPSLSSHTMVPTNRYSRLKQLSIEGSVELTRDLLSLIGSRELQKLTLHLISFPNSLQHDASQYLGLIDQCLTKWTNSLEDISLQFNQRMYSRPNSTPTAPANETARVIIYPNIPATLAQNLVSPVNLTRLSISGLSLGYAALRMLLVTRQTTLKYLDLPVNNDTPCLQLLNLREIALAFPNLLSLACGIEFSTGLPRTEDFPPHCSALSHGLNRLLLDPVDSNLPSTVQHADVARYVNSLFPNLTLISPFSPWKKISKSLKLLQTVRLDDLYRAPII
ncbi:hypothetical protein JR316_0012924 [Psilocybe cubensis]|uniref:Uncharacterized protein n=2 Tax=Psilocybe cubensis TaxID=181762 RepID=A0A8H7XR84_PSICU|nr:hypothetical protein JR316_0012924 [Psilocybe cubensis]KAH9474465.1 hypothetical protein JR316_0012924 [Psilocybe cubensis]